MSEILVDVLRGGLVESRHQGDIAVADGEGKLIAKVGDENRYTFTRSAIKSIQALALFSLWPEARDIFTLEERGVMLASHSGEAKHVAAVQSILAKSGLSADNLKCGIHPAVHEGTRNECIRKGEPFTQLQCNCSGKHAGMLTLCKHMGWDTETYLEHTHPVQLTILKILERLTDVPAPDIDVRIDNCSVPTFYLPLRNLATGMARLTTADKYFAAEPDFLAACKLLTGTFYPAAYYIGGTDRFCTDLNGAGEGRFVGKVGGEGVYMGALPGKDTGIALKIDDGDASGRAYGLAIVEVLHQLGALTEKDKEKLKKYHDPPIMNFRDIQVGMRTCVFKLEWASKEAASMAHRAK
jgi:L-asparaginase II